MQGYFKAEKLGKYVFVVNGGINSLSYAQYVTCRYAMSIQDDPILSFHQQTDKYSAIEHAEILLSPGYYKIEQELVCTIRSNTGMGAAKDSHINNPFFDVRVKAPGSIVADPLQLLSKKS